MLSEQHYKINLRLPCNFEDVGVYDCILDVSGTQIKCHRILLAINSKWFEEYFEAHQKRSEQLTIDDAVVVPVNDIIHKITNEHISDIQPKYMQSFIDIFYKNYLEISIENLPPLLEIAYIFKFPQISNILRTFYIDASKNDETLMHFAKEFIKNGLIDDAKALSEKIAHHFILAETKDPSAVFAINKIYEALSPPVFAEMLIKRHKQLEESKDQVPDKNQVPDHNQLIKKILDEDSLIKEPNGDMLVCQYIEEYVKFKGVQTLTENDRESLAKVFECYNRKGLDDTARPYMLKYDCDWFPARYARKHLKQILSKRKVVLTKLKKDMIKINKKNTNRWYVMSWTRRIRDIITNAQPLPVIEFIRTLGASANPINPIEYGLFNIDSTKEIIAQRKAENAFIHDPKLYFITAKPDQKTPAFIKFDLGKECLFKPEQFYFESRIHIKTLLSNGKSKLDTKGHVSEIKISYDPNKETDTYTFPEPSNPKKYDLKSRLRVPFSSAKFEVLQTDKGSDIFRLTTIELFGEFQP